MAKKNISQKKKVFRVKIGGQYFGRRSEKEFPETLNMKGKK